MTALTPAMEDYLELMLKLKQENKVVRVRDIAKGLNVKMPSVTAMLSNLAKKNLITHGKYEYAELTNHGLKKARDAQRKHETLFNFLTKVLKVDGRQADIDSCRMEHMISAVTLKKLTEFIGFMESCPIACHDWLDYYNTNCRSGSSKENCARHVTGSLEKSCVEKEQSPTRRKTNNTKQKALRG
jgi:DtxR family Mn-dependent transcriptional regulator